MRTTMGAFSRTRRLSNASASYRRHRLDVKILQPRAIEVGAKPFDEVFQTS